MQPFLSIIIPAYNAADTVEDTISSISDRSEIEIIVVNDGSTDLTTSQIEKAFEHFNQASCHLIEQKNGGLGHARNTGIENATGTYITFLDADDLWSKNRFHNIKRTTEIDPEVKWWYSGIIELSPDSKNRNRKLHRTPKSIFELIRFNPITPSAVVLHHSIAQDRIFIEDKNLMGLEDLILWVDLWIDGNRPYFSGFTDVYYRTGHGMSHFIEDHLSKYELALNEFERRGILPPSVSDVLMAEKHYQAGRHYQKLKMKQEALFHFSKAPFSIKKQIALFLLRFS